MRSLTFTHISKTPCFGCKERKVTADYNCHSVCPAYTAFVADRAANKQTTLTNQAVSEMEYDRRERCKAQKNQKCYR